MLKRKLKSLHASVYSLFFEQIFEVSLSNLKLNSAIDGVRGKCHYQMFDWKLWDFPNIDPAYKGYSGAFNKEKIKIFL